MTKIKTRLEIAKELWENRANGGFQGMDANKGGRAWIDGEFQLDELQALCVIIKDHAGKHAQTFDDYILYHHKATDKEDEYMELNQEQQGIAELTQEQAKEKAFIEKWNPNNPQTQLYWNRTPCRLYWALSYDMQDNDMPKLVEMSKELLAIYGESANRNNSAIQAALMVVNNQ